MLSVQFEEGGNEADEGDDAGMDNPQASEGSRATDSEAQQCLNSAISREQSVSGIRVIQA